MRALVYAPATTRLADLQHVADVVAAAGLEPVLLLCEWDAPLPTVPRDGAWHVVCDHRPLGKGMAVREAARHLLADDDPFVVLDADQPALTPDVVLAAADAASTGCWSRPVYRRPGHLEHRIAAVLRALGIDFPPVLEGGGLLAPVAGYPHPRHVLASLADEEDVDLDLALAHYATDPLGLAIFPAGAYPARPVDTATLQLRGLLEVAAGYVTWPQAAFEVPVPAARVPLADLVPGGHARLA